jgi:SulP family sulfate permease
VQVFDVQGPLFFGAAQRFEEAIGVVGGRTKAVVLRIRDVRHIDASGLHALEQIHRHCRRVGARFILVEVHRQPRAAMEKSGLAAEMGADNLVDSMEAALRRVGDMAATDTAGKAEG